tara:strand:+ start:524 stop:874 length:351 start_codon:yes stop_codon:yes gene_type:complete
MNQNSSEPSGSKDYPANNYIPKSSPNSRPKKFTKYAYVVKNRVAWDRMHKKYAIIEGQGKSESLPIALLHKDNTQAYEDACKVCDWNHQNKEARTLYITDGTYISPTRIRQMREKP